MNPIIPVYLNQSLVFDLIAMLRDGMSTITKVSTENSAQKSTSNNVSGSFGLGPAMSSLFKMDFSAGEVSDKSRTANQVKSEEKVHTPASLLFNLIKEMKSLKILKSLKNSQLPEVGDFVEFEAVLHKNPLVEIMDAYINIMEIATKFPDDTLNSAQRKQHEKSNSKLISQLTAISNLLKAGNTVDLKAQLTESSINALATVELDYLNDPHMSDLVEGKFFILGKVIRKVDTADETISFIRKTALSKMPPDILNEILGSFSTLRDDSDLQLPENEHLLPSPAFQVIPVAIYA